MKLIIIIPAYNEEDSIKSVIKGIPQNINGITEKEVIVIDDGSADNTRLAAEEAGVFVISHKENQGVGAVFQTGIREALKRGADIVVNIDGDGQFDSADIFKLIEPILKNEADLVTGSRFVSKEFIPKDMPKIKIWGNKMLSMVISWLINKRFYDVTCGFRAYSKEAALNLNLFGKFTYTQETFLELSFKGLRVMEVPLKVQYFPKRKSRMTQNLLSYIWQIFKIILRTFRDYKPLKFFGTIGFLIFLAGLCLDIFILMYYLETGSFTPYKSVAFMGGFLNAMGMGIFILGLVADMLLRIRMNQEKMLYFQKKKLYD